MGGYALIGFGCINALDAFNGVAQRLAVATASLGQFVERFKLAEQQAGLKFAQPIVASNERVFVPGSFWTAAAVVQ